MASVKGWTVEDVCGAQLNKLNCDGSLTDPNVPGNSMLLHSLIDWEYSEQTDDPGDSQDKSSNGAYCHNRKRDVLVTGYELTLRRCGIMHPAFLTATGIAEGVYNDDGCLIGTHGFCTSNVCYCTGCNNDECTDGGWSLIIWANAWEACTTGESIPLVDDDGNKLQHVFVAPRITRFRPSGSSRRSGTASDAATDWVADLKGNPSWGNGPVSADHGPLYPMINGPLNCPWAEYLSPVCFPGTCTCDTGYGSGFWDPADTEEAPVGV